MTQGGAVVTQSFTKLLLDMDGLLSGRISAHEFEKRFWEAHSTMVLELSDGHAIGFDVYNGLFYAVEDYVDDPELRVEAVGGAYPSLDEDALLLAVRDAREKFTEEFMLRGLDRNGYRASSE